MASDHFQGALNLLGQAAPALVSLDLPGHPAEPQLEVPWGAFRQGIGSSLRALLARSAAARNFPRGNFFKDCWVEGRIPRRAVLAATLWHIAFLAVPFPNVSLTPRSNPAFQNFQLTWFGPINDLPLVNIPRQKAKPSPRGEPSQPLPPQGADAFHPRQRIFTDPVHPTHPRQTLINPKAPPVPPKLLPNLPNIVLFEQVAGPAKPRLEINQEMLKKARPNEKRQATTPAAPPVDIPNMQQQVAQMNLPAEQSGPARPKLELNAGAAPRVAQKTKPGNPDSS